MVRWLITNNSTHGIITVFVDIKNGLKPSEVDVYYASTLTNKRLLSFILYVLIIYNRFLLNYIGEISDFESPKKPALKMVYGIL